MWIWIAITLLIIFIAGLAVLRLLRKKKKRYPLAGSKKLEPPKERIARQKDWEDAGDVPQPRRKRTIEEIKQEILRAQETED
jgi:cytochrome c-type biogenesis protein CcmH/NrfG